MKIRDVITEAPMEYEGEKDANKNARKITPRTVGKVILDPKGTAKGVVGSVLQRGKNAVKCAITQDPTYCNLAKGN